MKDLILSVVMSFFMGMGVMLSIIIVIDINTDVKQPEIKPCECKSYSEYKTIDEQYLMYVDSLVWSAMRNDKTRTKRLQDSVTSKLNKLYF
jgi:hypothetical protein